MKRVFLISLVVGGLLFASQAVVAAPIVREMPQTQAQGLTGSGHTSPSGRGLAPTSTLPALAKLSREPG